MQALRVNYRDALRHLRDLGLPVDTSSLDATDNRSGITAPRLWSPSPAEIRQVDRNLTEAYTEIELRLAESLRQRWVGAHRKLQEAGVGLAQLTAADFEDDAKLAALDVYHQAMNAIDRDEQFLAQLTHRRRGI